MGYFSKEIYDRKREYAYVKSSEGLEKIATYIVAENPKYKSLDLENEDVEDMINSEIEDLIEELNPIVELSHKRHEIHSTDRWSFVNSNMNKELNYVGDSYSDGDNLIYEVNSLNKKYNLVKFNLNYINDEFIPTDDDSTEDIFDYYNEDYDENEDESESRDKALEMIYYDWDNIIDKWSESVREWFGELNKKYGSDFPSR